ncbi:hypothetical protein Y956_03532, partial [Nipponia nippon]
QLEAGLHTHLWIPVLLKSKSGCTCIYQIAGTKKKSSFLLPIFLAFNLLCLLLAEVGGDEVVSPSEMWGEERGACGCPACWLCKGTQQRLAGRLLPLSCWKIKEILFCFGMNPRSFEVLGGICWPGKAFS